MDTSFDYGLLREQLIFLGLRMELLEFVTISTLVFTGIIVLLVSILLLVEANVVKKGDCKIFVNDDTQPIIAAAGKNLLATLAASKIYLPSACGGGGTCAMCKCQVLEGGGGILPTETGQISRKEQKQHYRLACQVKVRNDLKIHIPEEIFHIKKYDCVVKSNRNVATFIKELVLQLPQDNIGFQAGGYIQIDIPQYKVDFKDFVIEERFREDWDKYKLWNLKAINDEDVFRAYSMASHPAEKGIIMLNVRIATPPPGQEGHIQPGKASSYIFNLKPGDHVTVSGPYGEFFIKDTKREMIYIGGGAGMAPLRSHLFHLFHTLKTKDRKISYWYGARSKREMFYTQDFENIEKNFPNFKYNVALSAAMPEDNWTGYKGFIHQVLFENYLKNHSEPEEVEYYLCGPPMMNDAVLKMLASLGVPKEMIAFDSFG